MKFIFLLYMMQVIKQVLQQKLPVILTSAETGVDRLDWRGVTNRTVVGNNW